MESRSGSSFAGKKIHFIGVGGVGMCGLASILMDAGAIVTGSDPNLTPQVQQLQQRGARISREQDGRFLPPDVDLVVRTAAVKDDNPEYQIACAHDLPQLKYAQLLGHVMCERLGVAICGTHGKSTTTSMISFALAECGADPSFVIGGTVPQLGGGSRSGAGPAFVVEACEYDRSFHSLFPRIAIITNIEAEHLDCYRGGIREIIASFHQFAALVPENGLIIANGRDKHVAKALEGIKAPIQWVTCGLRGLNAQEVLRADGRRWWHTRVTGSADGRYSGKVFRDGEPAAELKLSLAGAHNLSNATMALAACSACGVEPTKAAEALGRFLGVDRRMSEVGQYNGALVVDDYGHHPTEIRTTLKALRERYNPQRLLCVFQPHQASRTRSLLANFGKSFGKADETIVSDIYSVRDTETDRKSVSSADVVSRITHNGGHARYLPQFDQIVEYLKNEARPGDLITTVGAGDIWQVGRQLVAG